MSTRISLAVERRLGVTIRLRAAHAFRIVARFRQQRESFDGFHTHRRGEISWLRAGPGQALLKLAPMRMEHAIAPFDRFQAWADGED